MSGGTVDMVSEMRLEYRVEIKRNGRMRGSGERGGNDAREGDLSD